MTPKHPDFSRYTDDELKTAQNHLDAVTFPEDAQRLAAEIAKRNNDSLAEAPEQSIYERFIDRLANVIYRTSTFIAFAVVFSCYLLLEIIWFYPKVTFDKTQLFVATPSHYECISKSYWTDLYEIEDHELLIHVGEETLYVPFFNIWQCQKLKQKLEINLPTSLPIWHDNFMVYRIGENSEYLKYEDQVNYNTKLKRRRLEYHYGLLLVILLGTLYLGLRNKE